MIEPFFGSILFTWIYQNTGRSTLGAILFHFMGNFTGELFELTYKAEIIQFFLLLIFALIVILMFNKENLKPNMKIGKEREGRWKSMLFLIIIIFQFCILLYAACSLIFYNRPHSP